MKIILTVLMVITPCWLSAEEDQVMEIAAEDTIEVPITEPISKTSDNPISDLKVTVEQNADD